VTFPLGNLSDYLQLSCIETEAFDYKVLPQNHDLQHYAKFNSSDCVALMGYEIAESKTTIAESNHSQK